MVTCLHNQNEYKTKIIREVFRGYNIGQNICGLLHVLAKFFFTTSKTELYYSDQKKYARVDS